MVSLLSSKEEGEEEGGGELPAGAARLTRSAAMDPHPPSPGTEESLPSVRMAAEPSALRASVHNNG